MRIGISALGSKRLTGAAELVLRALEDLGHEAENTTDSRISMGSYDFLVFMSEPRGLFGGIDPSIELSLAKRDGLQGKRCLAMLRRSGLRPESALQKFMNALEHEGLVVVDGEIFAGSDTIQAAVRNAPYRRG